MEPVLSGGDAVDVVIDEINDLPSLVAHSLQQGPRLNSCVFSGAQQVQFLSVIVGGQSYSPVCVDSRRARQCCDQPGSMSHDFDYYRPIV